MSVLGKSMGLDFLRLPFAIELRQFRDLLPIKLRRRKAQLLFKRLLQIQNVPVFTKYQRNHNPIIPRADLTIGASIPNKFPLLPARNVWSLPMKVLGFFVVRQGFVLQIRERKRLTFADWLEGLADQHAIHDDTRSDRQICGCKLVLRWYPGSQRICRPVELNRVSLSQISKSDKHVIAGIELQDFLHEL